MAGTFLEIPFENLPSLQALLVKRMPESVMIYNVIQLNLINRAPPTISSKFYSLNGNLTDLENAFILNVQTHEKFRDYLFVLVSHPETISSATLSALDNFLDWNKKIIIGDISPEFLPQLTELAIRRIRNPQGTPPRECYSYVLTAANGAKLSINEARKNVKSHGTLDIHQLNPDTDLDTVSKFCQWQVEDSGPKEELIRLCIASIASAGVDLDGELVSWGITTAIGTINMLYTKESYRGQGLAELTMKALAQLNGTYGLHSITHVLSDNIASQRLMAKLGLLYTHRLYWVDLF